MIVRTEGTASLLLPVMWLYSKQQEEIEKSQT